MNEADPILAQGVRPTMPWWASPAGITLGFLLPVLFLIAYVGEVNLPGVTIRGARFLSRGYIGLAALMLVVIAVAGWVGQNIRLRPAAQVSEHAWDFAAGVVGTIAFLAYLLWFKDFFLNPKLLLDTLLGSYRHERSEAELTPGITSLANFAPAFFSVYAYRIAFAGPRISRVAHLLCATLIPLTLFRVYVWSERLALIEAVVPFMLAAGVIVFRSRKPLVRMLVLGGPFVALPGLVFYFGIAEYVRSWASPTYSGKIAFWDFAIGRMASYYYTALNNGAGFLETTGWPTFTFEHTLYWVHRAPFSIGPQFSSWLGVSHFWTEPFLLRYADPEFNSPSGIYAVISDLGMPLGILYFSVLSAVGGLLARAYGEGRLIGAAVYPIFFLSFLEIFRYPYFGTPRAFTWVLGILLTLALASGFSARSRSRR